MREEHSHSGDVAGGLGRVSSNSAAAGKGGAMDRVLLNEAPPGNPRGGVYNTLSAGDYSRYKWAIKKDEIEFQSRMGAGAYGEVWAGQWRRNEVAIKSLHVSESLSEDDKNNFLDEMQLLSELRHPNIVRFLGACLEKSSMCILFELCPGSLYDYLYKHDDPLPEKHHLVKMFREVALGIYYLHCFDPPVLHLDLKSANVLLDDLGTAKVCDFGLSHTMEDAAAAAASGSMGSPQWTAPEKLRGQRYDEKADSYSYGILLYEVLARKVPYEGKAQTELVVAIICNMLPRPTVPDEQKVGWPREVVELMNACMYEDPTKRPDFAAILDTFEKIEPRRHKERRPTMQAIMGNSGVTAGSHRGTPRAGGGGAASGGSVLTEDAHSEGPSQRTGVDSASSSLEGTPRDATSRDGTPRDEKGPKSQSPRMPQQLDSEWMQRQRSRSEASAMPPPMVQPLEVHAQALSAQAQQRHEHHEHEKKMVLRQSLDRDQMEKLSHAAQQNMDRGSIGNMALMNVGRGGVAEHSIKEGSKEDGDDDDDDDEPDERPARLSSRMSTGTLPRGLDPEISWRGYGGAPAGAPAAAAGLGLAPLRGPGFMTGGGGGGGGGGMLGPGAIYSITEQSERNSIASTTLSADTSRRAPSLSSRAGSMGRRHLLAPSQLRVCVKQVDKTNDRKLVFVIECELDGVVWSVLRRERQVSELHVALSQLMRFVPDSPIAPRSWIWGRAAEQSGAVAKRVEDYLRELTTNGQWVWDEMAILRHFLQIPISSEKRQVRELMLNEIRTHGVKDVRKQMLGDICSNRKALRPSVVGGDEAQSALRQKLDARRYSSQPPSANSSLNPMPLSGISALEDVKASTLPPKETAMKPGSEKSGGGGGGHGGGLGLDRLMGAVREAFESGKDSARGGHSARSRAQSMSDQSEASPTTNSMPKARI